MKFKQYASDIKRQILEFELQKVSYFAAQSAFFMIISIFPFLILLITLSGFLPDGFSQSVSSIPEEILPSALKDFAHTLVTEAREIKSGTLLITVSSITAIWSSSKGTLAIIRGLDKFSGIESNKSWIQKRIKACVFTLIIALVILISFALLVAWDWLLNMILSLLNVRYSAVARILSYRNTFSFLLLSLIFTMIYSFMPSKKSSVKNNILGAVFAAVGWMAVSAAFSIYVANFSLTFYGSLTTIVLFMLWLYVCLWMLFIGAAINRYRQQKKNKKMG
ncbi:MAG: YihY/virulence factor BrkB family protein [Clostridia bacterium]|nr:YihY/virulence factor BrkB family protein [Clostridia bacterium]